MSEKWFEWQMRSGQPVTVESATITPQAQALVVWFPSTAVFSQPVTQGEYTAIVHLRTCPLANLPARKLAYL